MVCCHRSRMHQSGEPETLSVRGGGGGDEVVRVLLVTEHLVLKAR